MVSSFEELDVFKRSYKLALEIHKQTLQFPKLEQYALADQIRRASKSICANIAEGFGKQSASAADFKRFLYVSLGSSDEMKVWIKFCCDLEYIDKETASRWLNEYGEISRMIHGLIKRWIT